MNRYVIAGAVVISMLLIYFLLSGDGGGGDYLLEDYEACDSSNQCQHGVCCFIQGYDNTVCAPLNTPCLGVVGDTCSCADDTHSPCEGDCVKGATCCETKKGWMCTENPTTCLASSGETCSKEVGCRGSDVCCQSEEEGPFQCREKTACLGVKPGTSCDVDSQCQAPSRCCHSKDEGAGAGKECTDESQCWSEEGWTCSGEGDCYEGLVCCTSEEDPSLKCRQPTHCRSNLGASCKLYPCITNAKCCGDQKVCHSQCNDVSCVQREECGGLPCCGPASGPKKCLNACATLDQCDQDVDCSTPNLCCEKSSLCKTSCGLGETCQTNAQCDATLYCKNLTCQATEPEGSPCLESEECIKGTVCCHDDADALMCLKPSDCRTRIGRPCRVGQACQANLLCCYGGDSFNYCKQNLFQIECPNLPHVLYFDGYFVDLLWKNGPWNKPNGPLFQGQTAQINLVVDDVGDTLMELTLKGDVKYYSEAIVDENNPGINQWSDQRISFNNAWEMSLVGMNVSGTQGKLSNYVFFNNGEVTNRGECTVQSHTMVCPSVTSWTKGLVSFSIEWKPRTGLNYFNISAANGTGIKVDLVFDSLGITRISLPVDGTVVKTTIDQPLNYLHHGDPIFFHLERMS